MIIINMYNSILNLNWMLIIQSCLQRRTEKNGVIETHIEKRKMNDDVEDDYDKVMKTDDQCESWTDRLSPPPHTPPHIYI